MAVEIKADEISGTRGRLLRFTDTNTGAPLLIYTERIGAAFRLSMVAVYYDAPSTVDIEIVLVSAVSGYTPVLLRTISLVAEQYGVWIPEEELMFSSDDAIGIICPTGGPGVLCGAGVYLVEMGR